MSHLTTPSGPPSCDRSNCTPSLTPLEALPNTGRQLHLRDARKLINAEAFSAAQGNPFLVHATLHLRLSETFTPEAWPAFQTDLLDKTTRWMQRQGLIPAYAWVREAGPIKGPHVHCFAPVPQRLWNAFKLYLLRIGSFEPYGAGGEAVTLSGGVYGTHTHRMRSGLCCYVLKSLVPSTCNALGIRHHETQPVPIKRVGSSASIGPKARELAAWKELRSIADLHAYLHPSKTAEACHAA